MSDNRLKILVAIASLCIIGRTVIDIAGSVLPQPRQLNRQEVLNKQVRERCKEYKNDDQRYASCWKKMSDLLR